MVEFSSFVKLIAGLAVSSAIKNAANKNTASTGCNKPLPQGREVGHEYTIPYKDDQGRDRDYLLFIPPGYSTKNPNPVIFSYHGGDKTPQDQRDLDLLETPEFNKNHIVVYLRGFEVMQHSTSM